MACVSSLIHSLAAAGSITIPQTHLAGTKQVRRPSREQQRRASAGAYAQSSLSVWPTGHYPCGGRTQVCTVSRVSSAARPSLHSSGMSEAADPKMWPASLPQAICRLGAQQYLSGNGARTRSVTSDGLSATFWPGHLCFRINIVGHAAPVAVCRTKHWSHTGDCCSSRPT